ncbi:MAG: hypothetical protein O2814_04870 [Bacteroidetes bacterium]|nr:hypothetical protein [Bacteroidota bacterium]MDA1224690.1 hypothetical protein [Bacteroidota bacterium]
MMFKFSLLKIVVIFALSLLSFDLFSQGCCSGGTGSPIAGGFSQGVLNQNQMEIASSYQYQQSNKFKALDKDTAKLFDNLSSNYLYSRIAYGVTDKLTMSIETGYFINKIQIGLQQIDTIHSSGFGDLILFPRYQLLNKTSTKNRTELVLGLGYKIPIGKYNDSTLFYTNSITGQEYYNTSPPTVQPTTGAQDVMFYGFALREFTDSKIKLFTNLLYIKKGWNALGQKFGDYSSIGLNISQTVYEKLGVNLQLRAEHVSKMRADKNVDMVALYNIYVESTGSKKLFFVPQVSYSKGNFTFFFVAEIPLYQYANGTQVVSQHQATLGTSFRFSTKKSICKEE